MELPPRWIMAASKLTRVRSEGFSNNRAITRPGKSGSRRPASNLVFKSSVMEKMRSSSAAFSSAMVIKCRIISLLNRVQGSGFRVLIMMFSTITYPQYLQPCNP